MLSFGKINKKKSLKCFQCVCVHGWCSEGTVVALCLFYIILKMLSALDAVNFHTNTDRLSDCLVSASVRAHVSFTCRTLCTSLYKTSVTIVPAGGDVAKNSTFTTEVTSGCFSLHLVDRVG